jgi:hypothetical protein
MYLTQGLHNAQRFCSVSAGEVSLNSAIASRDLLRRCNRWA